MDELSLLLSSLDIKSTVYIRGISKYVTEIDILNHFNTIENYPITTKDIHYHPINKGIIYVTYHDNDGSKLAIQKLNRTELCNVIINVRSLIYNDDTTTTTTTNNNNDGVEQQMNHINKDPIIQRKVKNKGKYYNTDNNNNNDIDIAYTNTGIMINHNEYPIPTGKYLMKLLHISSLCIEENKQIISSLLNTNNTSKEVSESFACFNGLQLLGKLKNIDFNSIVNANVYVIGDGMLPFTSMVLSLLLPYHYNIYSIDPILDFDMTTLDSNRNTNRIIISRNKSEDFVIPDSIMPNTLSIVIACHSHAPLEEFWNRIKCKGKAMAVSIPCCGKFWSIMKNANPVFEYDDYEIFSPRRRVYLYSHD